MMPIDIRPYENEIFYKTPNNLPLIQKVCSRNGNYEWEFICLEKMNWWDRYSGGLIIQQDCPCRIV